MATQAQIIEQMEARIDELSADVEFYLEEGNTGGAEEANAALQDVCWELEKFTKNI